MILLFLVGERKYLYKASYKVSFKEREEERNPAWRDLTLGRTWHLIWALKLGKLFTGKDEGRTFCALEAA